MLKKIVKYKDFEGEKKEQVVYLNLSKMELIKLDGEVGGLENKITQAQSPTETVLLMELLENIILASYGERNGDMFIKNEEVKYNFKNTLVYAALVDDLIDNPENAQSFIASVAGVQQSNIIESNNQVPK